MVLGCGEKKQTTICTIFKMKTLNYDEVINPRDILAFVCNFPFKWDFVLTFSMKQISIFEWFWKCIERFNW